MEKDDPIEMIRRESLAFPDTIPMTENAKYGLPEYPTGVVAGPCVCGSWPGGTCLRCGIVPVPDGTFIDSHQRFRSNGTRLVQLPDWESQYVGTLETTRNAWLDEKEQASIDRTIKSSLAGLVAAFAVLAAVAFWVAIYLAWT